MSSQSGGLSSLDKIQFADLHVFVVPLGLWLDKYRTAFNDIALESVSAGFVRVPPESSLSTLRDHMEDQLGLDVVPENFVFLRSVGRCMAIVKNTQEDLLRAKDFLPPMAYSPEIFVLPGTHSYLARPIPEAGNVVIATQGLTTAGLSSTQPVNLPAIQGMNFHTGPQGQLYPDLYTPREQPRSRSESNNGENKSNSSRLTNQDDREYELRKENSTDDEMFQESAFGKHNPTSDGSDSEVMNSMQNSRISHRAVEDSDPSTTQVDNRRKEKPLLKNIKSKIQKKGSDSSGSTKSEPKTVKFIQPEVVPDVSVNGPPTPITSGRLVPSPQHKAGDAGSSDRDQKSNANEEETSQAKNSSPGSENRKRGSKTQDITKKKRRGRSRSPSFEREQSRDDVKSVNESKHAVGLEVKDRRSRKIPSIEDIEERSKFAQFPSPEHNRKLILFENEVDSGIAEDGSTPPFGDQAGRPNDHEVRLGYQDGGHGSDAYDNLGYHDDDTRAKNRKTGNEKQFSEDFQTGHDETALSGVTTRVPTVTTRVQRGENEIVERNTGVTDKGKLKQGQKPPAKKTTKKTDSLEDKFRIPKILTPPPIKIPTRGDKSLEKDSASAKDKKTQQVEELKAELRRAKQERVEVEKDRELKVRRAKNLQNQTLQKRNQAKNVWKKRFFDEKRKTSPLEEQVNRLRYDLQVQHKALLSYLESKDREGNKPQQGTDNKPSIKSNQRMLLARLQHEVEELRQRVEDTKMKLAAEMKMRDASQKELKEIREQLLEKKISLTQLSKHEKGFPGVVNNPEDITA